MQPPRDPPATEIASPCHGTCGYDAALGQCLDCGRLLGEIVEWPAADTARRLAIRAAAAARLAAT
ncbi:MAG: DUF1289 domain-containing protein [Paracraurococcus sp.]